MFFFLELFEKIIKYFFQTYTFKNLKINKQHNFCTILLLYSFFTLTTTKLTTTFYFSLIFNFAFLEFEMFKWVHFLS